MKARLAQLRQDVRDGKKALRITSHAQVEAAKDGILLADLKAVFDSGHVVEAYPERDRWLLYGATLPDQIPIHIVVEETAMAGVVITAYVPDRDEWLADSMRRKKK
jgi:hypothetical protein